MMQNPSDMKPVTNNQPDDLPLATKQEIARLLALGYPRDMLHVTPEGQILVYKLNEYDDILEMWKEMKQGP